MAEKKTKRFVVKRIARPSGVLHEHIVTVDAEDAYHLRNSYWVAQYGHGSNGDERVYIVRNTGGGSCEFLHHVIVGAAKGESVDFINGDSMDCRKVNLLRQSERVQELD